MAAGKQVHIGKLDICPTEQEGREGEERMNNLHAPPLMIASERFSTNFGIPRHGRGLRNSTDVYDSITT